jgi:hypothetical protein
MDNYAATAAAALGGCGFAILLQHLRALGSRLNQLSRVEGKLDALLRANGVDYDPLSTVPVDVRHAVEQGEYIAAITRLRAATGLGLKDAKEQIDELRRRQRPVSHE